MFHFSPVFTLLKRSEFTVLWNFPLTWKRSQMWKASRLEGGRACKKFSGLLTGQQFLFLMQNSWWEVFQVSTMVLSAQCTTQNLDKLEDMPHDQQLSMGPNLDDFVVWCLFAETKHIWNVHVISSVNRRKLSCMALTQLNNVNKNNTHHLGSYICVISCFPQPCTVTATSLVSFKFSPQKDEPQVKMLHSRIFTSCRGACENGCLTLKNSSNGDHFFGDNFQSLEENEAFAYLKTT